MAVQFQTARLIVQMRYPKLLAGSVPFLVETGREVSQGGIVTGKQSRVFGTLSSHVHSDRSGPVDGLRKSNPEWMIAAITAAGFVAARR